MRVFVGMDEVQRQGLAVFFDDGDGPARIDCRRRFAFRHHGDAQAVGHEVDDGLRVVAQDLAFRREAVGTPELLQVSVAARRAGHFDPNVVFQALGYALADSVAFGFGANQRIMDIFQENAADAHLFGGAEEKAAVQFVFLNPVCDFAAHAVLDVQTGFRFAPADEGGEAGNFGRVHGVNQAEADFFGVVGGQRFGKVFQPVFVLQQGFGLGQEDFACAGQAHAVAVADKQRCAQFVFNGFDLCRNGGLG